MEFVYRPYNDTTTLLSLPSQSVHKHAYIITITHNLHIFHSRIIYHANQYIQIHYTTHEHNHNSSSSFIACVSSYNHIEGYVGTILP